MIPSGRSRFLVAIVLAGLVLAGTVVGILVARGGGDDPATAAGSAGQERVRLDLGNALLTVSDLPTGWSAVDPGRHVDDTTVLCGDEFSPAREPMAEAKAAFRQQVGGVMSQRLLAYSDDGADEVVDGFASATNDCSEWTVKREGEPGQKFTLRELSFPQVADETVALELTTTVQTQKPITVRSHLVVIRRGNVINLIAYVPSQTGGSGTGETERLARLADEKLRRTA